MNGVGCGNDMDETVAQEIAMDHHNQDDYFDWWMLPLALVIIGLVFLLEAIKDWRLHGRRH